MLCADLFTWPIKGGTRALAVPTPAPFPAGPAGRALCDWTQRAEGELWGWGLGAGKAEEAALTPISICVRETLVLLGLKG